MGLNRCAFKRGDLGASNETARTFVRPLEKILSQLKVEKKFQNMSFKGVDFTQIHLQILAFGQKTKQH